ncbi:MAG: N-acetylmuramoyl-L-alanine amidase [Bacteroidota bacterium]|nr:N-acetylmuramoyl-L-alanine amidase [Bacteroidota bacterium]
MKRLLFLAMIFSSVRVFSQSSMQDFFYVRTTDSLPFLNYGLGEDRLGGAKMTFLDSNVVLKVVDSVQDFYKVQLSQLHFAYIEKKKVAPAPPLPQREHLASSWKVYGDDHYDYVTIKLDAQLPYQSEMQINPTRIIVYLYGVTSNTNWITQLSSAREIKNVWYEQPEDDVMKVIIELKHSQDWGYHIFYEPDDKLTIRIKRRPKILTLNHLTIAIDPGHGGDNEGATGVRSHIREKNYTLMIAKLVRRELLLRKAHVIMTRTKDTTLSMYERISYIQQKDPDLLVSIHLNDADIDTVRGVSTYYRYIGFRKLSQSILSSLLLTGLHEYGNIGSFNFALNGPTEYPNCLVEVAFLSNRSDERKILNPRFRQLVAKRIVLGIMDFLKKSK